MNPSFSDNSLPKPVASRTVNVICMKWGDLYGPEYVNRLFHGVRRHLSISHRFVCLTDDSTGLHQEIEHFPLPQIHIPDGESDLRWRKLTVFTKSLYDLKGTALFLDIDIVIVGDLDSFFTYPGRFLLSRDDDLALPKPLRWINPARARRMRRVGNSSVFRFEIGYHASILENYLRDPARAIKDQPNYREQEFLSEQLFHQGILDYWPSHWCVSFKYHCVPLFGAGYFRNPAPPPHARIVVFAGSLSIPDAINCKSGRWYRRVGPSKWLAENWQEGSGESNG